MESDGAEIAGIVGFADLAKGEAVEEVLAAQGAAGGGRFRDSSCRCLGRQ